MGTTYAGPVPPPGLRQVSHDQTLTGSGLAGGPLGLAACASSGQAWVWSGAAFVCATTGGITSTAGSGVLPVTTDSRGDLGSSHVSDTGGQIVVSEAIEATSFQVTSSGPTITEGSSAPSGSCSNGSIYLDSNGGSTWGCIGTAWLPMLADVIAATLPGTSTNDWNPTNLAVASTLAVTTTGATNTLTGLTAPAAAGRRITIINIDASNNLIIASNSSSSSAANRITGPWGTVNIVLPGGANASVTLEYESSSRWRIIAYSLNDYPSIISDSTYTVGGSSGPTWSSGSAAPSGSCATGSMYSRTSGAIGFYVCASSVWLTVVTSIGITNSAGSGTVPVTIDGSGDLGSSSLKDDGTNVTVEGLKPTVCTSSYSGVGGLTNLPIPAGCTYIVWTPTSNQSLVGLQPPANGSQTITIYENNSLGGNYTLFPLNTNATTTAWQIEGVVSQWLTVNNTITWTYDTVNSKWSPSVAEDIGTTNVNGPLTATSGFVSDLQATIDGVLTTTGTTPSAAAILAPTLGGTRADDWSPTGWGAGVEVLEVAAGASEITSLVKPSSGSQNLTICATSGTVQIDNEGTDIGGGPFGTAANRFRTQGGAAWIILTGGTNHVECQDFYYSPNQSRWIQKNSASTLQGMSFVNSINAQSSGSTIEGLAVTNAFTVTGGALSTLSGGASGINGYGATHIEQNDEWMLGGFNRITAATTPLGDSWTLDTSGSISGALGVLGKGRPGIWEMDFGVGAAGAYLDTHTGNNSVDFTTGNWTFEWVGGWPTLSSTSSGTATMYAALVGFFDGGGSISPSNGCFFMYDAGNVSTLGNNSSKVQNLEATCVTGGSHTTYLLNGSGNCDASFVKGTVAATALTYPNTGIQHLKVVMTGHTEADFYTVNGIIATQVCKITTNIPATTSVPVGMQLLFASEAAAGTGARQMDTDYTHWSVDLTSLRSP